MDERQALRAQFQGENSHVGFGPALEGLEPALAGKRVPGAPHTIFQELQHLLYWQDITLARLRGQKVEPPNSAALGWQAPESPEDQRDWDAARARFAEGLRALESLAESPGFGLSAKPCPGRETSAREELLMVQGHNSYHLGRIVLLRQLLGSWPPPKGGSTW